LSSARRRAGGSSAGALVLVLGACGGGTPSPDLFVVHRDGTVPGAKLVLLVSDTSVRCNDGATRPLPSAGTIDARVLADELLELQEDGVALPPPSAAQIFRFSVRTQKGTLRYPDTAQRPSVLPRLTRFVRRTAIDVCGLRR